MRLIQKISLALVGISVAFVAMPAVTDQPLLPDTGLDKHEMSKYQMPDTSLQRDYCPPATNLTKDPVTQLWSADSGWKATAPSFVNSVTSFIGAQWVGVSVGVVICLYGKAGRSDFPVAIQRGTLVPEPLIGGVWSADLGGYMACKSNDVHDCPFFIQISQPPKNVYDQLDFYKGKPTETD
jgi:hypothetical protein